METTIKVNDKPVTIKTTPALQVSQIKGDIEGFPIEVVEKMLSYQQRQKGYSCVSIFCKSRGDGNEGFDWYNTPEGFTFWEGVILNRNFDLFFKKYPKTESYGDLISHDLVISTDVGEACYVGTAMGLLSNNTTSSTSTSPIDYSMPAYYRDANPCFDLRSTPVILTTGDLESIVKAPKILIENKKSSKIKSKHINIIKSRIK